MEDPMPLRERLTLMVALLLILLLITAFCGAAMIWGSLLIEDPATFAVLIVVALLTFFAAALAWSPGAPRWFRKRGGA